MVAQEPFEGGHNLAALEIRRGAIETCLPPPSAPHEKPLAIELAMTSASILMLGSPSLGATHSWWSVSRNELIGPYCPTDAGPNLLPLHDG